MKSERSLDCEDGASDEGSFALRKVRSMNNLGGGADNEKRKRLVQITKPHETLSKNIHSHNSLFICARF